MLRPAVAQLMTRRGWLTRGESIVASTGLAIAVILFAAMAASTWWTARTQRESMQSAREEQLSALGSLLSQSAETLLAADELATVRLMISDAARSNALAGCRVVLADGQVVADIESSKITAHRLPDKWAASEQQTSQPPERSAAMSFPLSIPNRGEARLEFWSQPIDAGLKSWEAQSGLGLIGAIGMLALLVIYRRMRSQLRAMGSIREALLAKHAGEKSHAAMIVQHPAPEAKAWNDLIGENERLNTELLVERVREEGGAHRESGNDLEGVCDAMWQGLLLVDDQLRIKYANGAAAVLLRATRDEMVGKEIASLAIDNSLLDSIRQVVSGTLRRRVTNEVKLEGESGQGVLRFHIRPVRRGDRAAAMVIVEDITQQRLAEEARNLFVAQAAHELRMPLTNIRLYTESALEEGESDMAVRAKCLNVINQESKRLERIVGDMLSVAEIEAGTLKVRMGDLRLETLFEELKNDYVAQAGEKDIALKFNLPPKLPAIRADRDKVVLALHNLIGNAIKYTPSKGTVNVNVEVTDMHLIVEVADSGIGIRAEETDLIFDKFYRSKDPRTSDVTGTGLGLSVARELIRLHRGDITVRSQLNQGSTFTLTIPTLAEAA
jgi:PAS domain S-box-containing protein